MWTFLPAEGLLYALSVGVTHHTFMPLANFMTDLISLLFTTKDETSEKFSRLAKLTSQFGFLENRFPYVDVYSGDLLGKCSQENSGTFSLSKMTELGNGKADSQYGCN